MKTPRWWRELREFDQRGLFIERVDGHMAITKRGYVYDRRIFRAFTWSMIGIIILAMFTSGVGWREFYLHCPTEEEAGDDYFGPWCSNPFYLNCNRPECESIVLQEKIPAGFTIGTPPSAQFFQLVRFIELLAVVGFAGSFVLNHRLHNRGRSLKTMFPELEVEE